MPCEHRNVFQVKRASSKSMNKF